MRVRVGRCISAGRTEGMIRRERNCITVKEEKRKQKKEEMGIRVMEAVTARRARRTRFRLLRDVGDVPHGQTSLTRTSTHSEGI